MGGGITNTAEASDYDRYLDRQKMLSREDLGALSCVT